MVKLLTDEERAELRRLLCEEMLDSMFGDGLEREYVMDGFPAFKGVNNMSDLELLDELGHYDAEADVTPKQKAAAWRKEMSE